MKEAEEAALKAERGRGPKSLEGQATKTTPPSLAPTKSDFRK